MLITDRGDWQIREGRRRTQPRASWGGGQTSGGCDEEHTEHLGIRKHPKRGGVRLIAILRVGDDSAGASLAWGRVSRDLREGSLHKAGATEGREGRCALCARGARESLPTAS